MAGRAPVRAAALRLGLLVVAVMAGILAMHAVGAAPHGSGPAGHASAAALAPSGEDAAPAGHASGWSVAAVLASDSSGQVWAADVRQPDAPAELVAAAAACVAMLFSASVLVRRRTPVARVLARPREASGPVRTAAREPAPPPDLLRVLCVMRT